MMRNLPRLFTSLLLLLLPLVPGLAQAEGWVLIIPRSEWDNDFMGIVKLEEPMGLWSNDGAFDTASQCEDARKLQADKTASDMGACNVREAWCRYAIVVAQKYSYARCVPFDLWWKEQHQAPR